MNLGLGNLTELKAALLPVGNQADTAWDEILTEIGRGVAATFNTRCNRKLERVADDTCECSADRSFYVVPRYPIEAISLVEQRDSIADGWEEQPTNDVIYNRRDEAGVLFFGNTIGDCLSQIRITYTGGYWFDTSEDESETLPAGATALPADLKHAWLTQCRHVFEQVDGMGARALGVQAYSSDRTRGMESAKIEILPAVAETLKAYVRFA